MTLEQFVNQINDFDGLPASNKIDYFIYYYTVVKGQSGVKSKNIDESFDELKIPRYTNIPQYLSNNSKKIKKKAPKFIVQNGLYHLERTKKNQIDAELKVPPIINPTSNFFPIELFKNTRGYLQTIAQQAAGCYDGGLYDACSVMTRKLLEVLIIEAFERYKIEGKIKNGTGNFHYLGELVDAFKDESAWNIGRNAKNSLPSLKKMGDMSAHNRRYTAKQTDLDKMKGDLRIVLEELVHLIDYPNWH